MSRKKKTLLIVGGGLILVVVAVVLVVLFCPGGDVATGEVQIDMEDGTPVLVYSKLIAIDDEGLGHSAITVCQVGSEPQKLSDEVNRFDVGENGDVICYTVRSFQEEDTLAEGDLYLQYPSGEIILCSEDVKNFEASDEGSHVIYNKDENLGVLHVCKYSSEGELVLSDSIDMQARAVYWQSSADQKFIAIRVQYEQYADADGDPIYLYHDGETELISEIVWSSADSQGVSCDGKVLYMTDRDENTESGVLYMKPFGEEPDGGY